VASVGLTGFAIGADKADKAAKGDKTAMHAADSGDTTAAVVKLPAGIAPKEAKDTEDIRELLGKVTEAAVAKDGFNDVVERLVDQDRDRLNKGVKGLDNTDELNNRIVAIRDAWKAKYGEALDIHHKDAYGQVAILQGEVQDWKMAMAHWPVIAARGTEKKMEKQEAVQAAAAEGDTTGRDKSPLTKTAAEQAELEKGREVALATIPMSHGLPQITASLIGEKTGWRIDIPNGVEAGPLYNCLLARLNHFADMQAQWPDNKNDASLMLTHEILLALYDVPMNASGDHMNHGKAGMTKEGAKAND
jgi:hypothetical protein